MDQAALQQAAEMWSLRRNICDLQLEIIRRDLAALQDAADRAPEPHGAPQP